VNATPPCPAPESRRNDRNSLAPNHQTCPSSTNNTPSAIRTAERVCAAHGRRSPSLCQQPRPAAVRQPQAEPIGSGASRPAGLDAGRYARDWMSEKPDHHRQRHRALARQPQAARTPRQPHDRPRAEPPTPHEYWSVDLARSALLHVAGFSGSSTRTVEGDSARRRAAPSTATTSRPRAQLPKPPTRPRSPEVPVKAGALIQAIRRQTGHTSRTSRRSELRAKGGAPRCAWATTSCWKPSRGVGTAESPTSPTRSGATSGKCRQNSSFDRWHRRMLSATADSGSPGDLGIATAETRRPWNV